MEGLEQLDSHSVSKLFHELGIAPYMKDNKCNRRDVPYYPNTAGWNTGRSRLHVGQGCLQVGQGYMQVGQDYIWVGYIWVGQGYI